MAAVSQVDSGLVFLIRHRGQKRGHVLRREVGLQVRGPEGYQSVACGVGLVKRIRRERLNGAPQRIDRALGVTIGEHALAELLIFLGQYFWFLLTHGFTEAICFTSGVVRKFLRNTHDLLLIHDQAVSLAEDFFQCFFQLWVNRRNFLAPILTVRVVPVRVHTHRSWTIQR